MMRKIIRQGNNSYTVTLPIRWIRQHRLEEGGEVAVVENEDNLSITTEIKPAKKSINLTINENHSRGIRFLLQNAYRQNYDSITVNYSLPEVYQTVRDIAEQYFIGLEVVDKSKNSCTLTVVVESDEDKFRLFCRKMFLLIRESLAELGLGKSEGIHASYLKLYAYQNYGKRYIYSQKRGLSSYDYYSLLSYLLNIQADIDKVMIKKKGWSGFAKISKLSEEIEINFYRQNAERLMAIGEEIQSMIKKLENEKPTILLHYQLEIARLLYGALSPIIGIVLYEADKTD